MRFAESVEAGMTPLELTQWESNSLSAVVPAVDGRRHDAVSSIISGHLFALDLESGKMLWRSASFHHLELLAQQNMTARMSTPSRFAIVAAGEHVWALARDMKDQNFFAPFQLTCRRADNGEVVWKSADLPDYAQFDLVGLPLLADGKLFIAAKSSGQSADAAGAAAAVRPGDPAARRQGALEDRGRHVPPGPAVLLLLHARYLAPAPTGLPRGAIYLDTHVGVLARLDAETGRIRLGIRLQDGPVPVGISVLLLLHAPGAAGRSAVRRLQTGEAFLVKGMQSERLYAVEPNAMKVLWERPITKASRLLGVDDQRRLPRR